MDEIYQIREWAPCTNLVEQVPLRPPRGGLSVFIKELNITCIYAVDNFLALGTDGGAVYWYDRKNDHMQRLDPENANANIICLSVVDSVEFMLAAGDTNGKVHVFQIQKKLPPDLELVAPKKPIERYTVRDMHQARISCCEWSRNGMKLFSGDQMGIVVLTEFDYAKVENAGFKGLVLTVDAPFFGPRRNDVRNKFSLPDHLTLGNFKGIQATGLRSTGNNSGLIEYVENQFDPTLTWEDVQWLIKFTKLPVVVKGIMTAEDAILAREYGVAGIIVSNHGGRQLDTVPATIEALPEIVAAVGNDVPIMLDGGVRDGGDVFKALALGAKLVFLGRPALWGLACGGQAGVEKVLEVLKKDLEVTMALAGCSSLKDISREMVKHENHYAKL